MTSLSMYLTTLIILVIFKMSEKNVQNQQKYVSRLLVTEKSLFYLSSLGWKPSFLLNREPVQKLETHHCLQGF